MWDDEIDHTFAYETTLRTVSGSVPDDAVDWDAFHTRLSARAELSLARLRHPRPALTVTTTQVHAFPRRAAAPQRRAAWWQHAARWSPAVITGALAASVVLVAAIRKAPKESTATLAGTVVASISGDGERSRAAFESAVVGHASASSIATTFLPSATDLLIPLGAENTPR